MKKYIVNLLLIFSKFIVIRKLDNTLSNNIKKVNLGCGMHCLNGWLNIDGSLTSLLGTNIDVLNKLLFKFAGSSEYYDFSHFNDVIKNKKLYWRNLSDGIPLNDNSIDVVFSSHFLEHLTKTDGQQLLNDIYRILKPGGLVRILVPDLDLAIQRFNKGEINETLDLFFYTSEKGDFSAHKYNYTFASLKNKLEEIGFTSVVKQSHKKGECPDIEYLDIYPDHSLYVEAKK
jgi:predicted SAM-dependent methyltransferase